MSIAIGAIFANLTATQPDVRALLEDFEACLADYREHADAWYGDLLDVEQQFQVGDQVRTQDKDSSKESVLYATCPENGKLTLIHSFEAARFVPIGNTPVRLVPVVDGKWYGKNQVGQEINLFIDSSGIKEVENLTPHQQYRITFFPNPTRAEIDTLFASYQGLIGELSGWLETQWSTDFLPLWQAHDNDAISGRLLQQLDAEWAGFLKSILSLWDDIASLYDLIANPKKHYEQLKKFFTEEQLKRLLDAAPEALHNALLLASDEPLMWIYMAVVVAWVKMLPPQVRTEVLAELKTDLLLNLLVGIILTGGIGLAVRVGVKATRNAGKSLRLIEDFTATLMDLSRKHARAHAEASKPLLLNGSSSVNSARKANVEVRPHTPIDTGSTGTTLPSAAAQPLQSNAHTPVPKIEPDAQIHTRRKKENNTQITQHERPDDVPRQPRNQADQPAQCVKNTRCDNEPVSMVTGEELLTLRDGELDGLLPLTWTRLYRTSAVETDNGLGFGWSHTLSHTLQQDTEGVLWTDHENRRIHFPQPTLQRPAISNSLAEAAIYLGDEPGELILTQAGERPRFYHFHAGRLTGISDAYENRLHITYDLLDRILRVDNGAGRCLCLRYDNGHIAAVDYQQRRPEYTDRAERQSPWLTIQTLVTYQYTPQGQLRSATNAAGERELYRYDEQHVILERQLAGGASFYWAWERSGKQARCIRQWASFSQIDAHYEWDDAGKVTVINADGSQQVYVHDDDARLISETGPDGAERQNAYDQQGRLVAEKDPLGAVTEYRYNDAGRLISIVPAKDEPTHYRYFDGQLIEVRRGKARWKYTRNDQGDITQQIDPLGQQTHYRYDRQGRLLEIRHADGSRHTLGWNTLGQLLEEQLPDGGQRKYRYDALGRQIIRQDENGGISQYQWDAVHRLIQITLPGGATQAFSYNAYGKVTAERDPLGRVTRYEYADHLHLVSRRINPDGSQLRYRYDNARLLLTEIENEHGERYHLEYHSSGLIQQETGFDGRRTAYAYDLNGYLLQKIEFGDDGSELTTDYQRDTRGRLRIKALPDGSRIHYGYDTLGRLLSVNDGHWPLAYEYDLQNRLVTEHQGWGTLRYEYDPLGQLSHCRLPDGSTLDYRYAPGGQLTGIDLNGSQLTRHQFSARLEQQRQQGQLLSQYQYDEQGRLQTHAVSQQQQNQQQHHLYQRHYAYDANGNLSGISDSRKGSRSFQYDPLDRLIAVRGSQLEGFAHDPAGNLLGHNQLPVANLANVKGNRILMQGDRHYEYDAFGNLSRERRGTEHKLVTQYQYDCQHRLVSVTLPDGSAATYQYDAFGRRISKTIDGHTTEFLWQGEHLIAESAPNRYRSYIYEPGTFRPLAMLKGEGPQQATPLYYQLDHLGTPQELTAPSGEIMWSATYHAYGNVVALDVQEIDNPLRFQGQYFDTETGLHYNRHRYYNPNTGRFLTPDPIKLAGGLNSYRYVNNPTGWVDPLGLNGCPGAVGGEPIAGGVEEPTVNAKVAKTEPEAPRPQMTSEQRKARIDELSEANAKRRVQGYETQYNMHTIGKHSPEIPDAALKQRAIDGTNPINGITPKDKKGNPSSQFKTWKFQMHSINEALTRDRRGLKPFNGKDIRDNDVVRMEMPGVGRGYTPNKKDKNAPKYNDSMNNAEVKFSSPNNPFTAFPTK